MPSHSARELVGSLTKKELQDIVPPGTFTRNLLRIGWSKIIAIIRAQPDHVLGKIRRAAEMKHTDQERRAVQRATAKRSFRERTRIAQSMPEENTGVGGDGGNFMDEAKEEAAGDRSKYLVVPTEEEVKACFRAFRETTSNSALALSVCVVCGREMMHSEGEVEKILDIPNAKQQLHPEHPHPCHTLCEQMLLAEEHVSGEGEVAKGWVCFECHRSLAADKLPKFALANNLWIGKIPHELAVLTLPEELLISRHFPRCYIVKLYPRNGCSGNPDHLQRGMVGNVSLYDMNVDAVARMLEGQLLPQPVEILASVLAVTYVGTKKLPKNWLKSTFRVRRRIVYEALIWLKTYNPVFADIHISEDLINRLPEDDVPSEITSVMRHEDDADIAQREQDSYVPGDDTENEVEGNPNDEEERTDDDQGATVIPLKFLGVTDTDLNKLPLNDLMKYALTNLGNDSKESGYVVQHSRFPVSDFGKPRSGDAADEGKPNPLAAAYPKLFPYGVGGIEAKRRKTVGFDEHIRWALQYYDRRFRIHHSFPFVAFSIQQKREALQSARVQMRRRDFEQDSLVIGSVTVADLKQAEKEEASRVPISNPRVRLLRKHVFTTSGRVRGSDNSRGLYRGQIWGTCLIHRAPSLWITINPSDIHDPVAQIFVGEEINMDDFIALAGPDSNRRAQNIAKDPYGAAKYFFYIINAVLRTLFQIEAKNQRVHSRTGILGKLSAYFGVVEAQGRGSLHVHMFIWLCDTPNMDEMHSLLKSEEFRESVRKYIRHNIRAHLDGLDEEEISRTRKEAQLPFRRPLDPDSPGWARETAALERQVVRAQQIHTCTKATCLRFNKHGKLVCKRHAPWEISGDDYVDESGKWLPKRSYGFINNYCPAISTTLCCNNDIKLVTSGRDTKDTMWYSTDYQTKKQNKNNNVSAVMAKSLMYHQEHSEQLKTLLDRNRLLLFRCQHAINREMELSGPQVIAYLMGWGDTFCSHHYVPLYWASIKAELLKTFPRLKQRDILEGNDVVSGLNGDEEDEGEEQGEDHLSNKDSGEGSEDVVILQASASGGLCARSVFQDYELRGNELDDYSYMEFILNTYEEKISADHDEGRGTGSRTSRGRPLNERSCYMEEHPKHRSHRRVVRCKGHNTLPNVVGPFPPRRDDPHHKNLYYAAMLSLLTPWRSLDDLLAGYDSWEEAFSVFANVASQWDKDIMAGVQYYYDCKSATMMSRHHDTDNTEDGQWSQQSQCINGHDSEDDESENGIAVELTEADLKEYQESQKTHREEAYGLAAVAIAQSQKVFGEHVDSWKSAPTHIGIAKGDDYAKLQRWQAAMTEDITSREGHSTNDPFDEGDVTMIDATAASEVGKDSTDGSISLHSRVEEHMLDVDPSCLLKDQRRAYDIIDWHLAETLAERNPPQLLMHIPGEGGVGKSKTIQTITENFQARGVGDLLVKAAYTGIAASIIDGKTLHTVALIPTNGREHSAKSARRLVAFWKGKKYLIIDELSMIARAFLARLSAYIARGKSLGGTEDADMPFGGVNVIIVGDFHQFPPVVGKKSAPLFYPCNPSKDTAEEMLGRKIYEQFTTVVRLKEQVRVTDPEWLDLLRHVRHGSCRAHHIDLLRSLIITDPRCPPTDFTSPPWNNAVLITPRHSVRRHWNSIMAQKECQRNMTQLFLCKALDTIQGRALTLKERFAVATKQQGRCGKSDERAGLPNIVELAIGMKVMVTFNVETDLDVANGARGEITDIVLDEHEAAYSTSQSVVELDYPPAYVLIRLNRTKAAQLDGLEERVLPLTPMERTFHINFETAQNTVTRRQLPITAAYAFTDYRAQGQTISQSIIDIGTPPSGGLTPFNVYVALSRGHGKENIRLLRDFDERLLTMHPNEHLRIEDERLARAWGRGRWKAETGVLKWAVDLMQKNPLVPIDK
ncbi:hypothetical protein BV22DRAFT_1047590 [Leucogyrophana mollusca]|uniref:Uncharacterized protein n=1 Tax=Leucogyrophana mollusca TaxID=85980 RepID=A0ACB8BEL9_9AGAM|nr:hypothetical protein BV22DRAFT_1047590 [Leucogyrophana mollusca]